jgi:hypothetical protein
MGRKSSLTPEQWAEIERKHLIDGIPINALAKQYKVDESTIRKKINPNKPEAGKNGKTLQALAFEKIEAEKRIKDISAEVAQMPMVRQVTFNDLTKKLSSISEHLASAAEYGAITAHRLAGIAHGHVEKIDDAEPEKSMEALQRIGVLTKMANASSEIGLNLLKANKDAITQEDDPTPVMITFGVQDARKYDDKPDA